MLALATVAVVTPFPLFLSKKPRHAAVLGGILLCWCLLAFIVAFILAGFVAVGYGAPAPDCAIVRCNDGGIACTVTVGHDTYTESDIQNFRLPGDNFYYILDDNVAALNNMVSSSGYDPLLCLPYLNSTYDGNGSSPTLGLTLYPEFPQRLPNLRPVDDRLLRDAYYQRSVLCGQRQNFVYIYGSNKTPGWSVSAITGLNRTLYDYVNTSSTTTVADLIADRNLGLVAYSSLRFGCFATSNPLGNTLCDTSQPDLGGLSVSATGAYITGATVSSSGGKIFTASGTSDQVAASLWAVIGLFSVVVLTLVMYLWKHK